MKNQLKVILKWGALLGAGLSLIKLLSFLSLNIDYPFEPVADLLMVIGFVAALYMGIKEQRDVYQDGLIKYTKAFALGIGITLVAFVVVSIYMVINYNYIDRGGIERINKQNVERTYQNILKDTVTHVERDGYLAEIQDIIKKDSDQNRPDSLKQVDSLWQEIFQQATNYICNPLPTSTINYQLSDFAEEVIQRLAIITENSLEWAQVDEESAAHIRQTLQESYGAIRDKNPANYRFQEIYPLIPQHHNAIEAAIKHSLSILLYGILLDIFVALFLFRNEKTICSRNGNEDTAEEGDGCDKAE